MNIFILSLCIIECATFHCNAHCLKMCTEYAQLLCSAHRILDEDLEQEFDKVCYKKSHKNHPCAIWVRQSSSNYLWLYELFKCLCREFTRRFGGIHLSQKKLQKFLGKLPKNIPIGPLTPFAQAITNKKIQESDPVLAYRIFYLTNKKEKGILSWKTRDQPPWINEVQEYIQEKYGNTLIEEIQIQKNIEKEKKEAPKRVTHKVIKDFLLKKIKENPELKDKLRGII